MKGVLSTLIVELVELQLVELAVQLVVTIVVELVVVVELEVEFDFAADSFNFMEPRTVQPFLAYRNYLDKYDKHLTSLHTVALQILL